GAQRRNDHEIQDDGELQEGQNRGDENLVAGKGRAGSACCPAHCRATRLNRPCLAKRPAIASPAPLWLNGRDGLAPQRPKMLKQSGVLLFGLAALAIGGLAPAGAAP